MRFQDVASKLTAYGGWTPGEWENFDGVAEANTGVTVTMREFADEKTGLLVPCVSMCFFRKDGQVNYIKLDRDSKLMIGQNVDMNSIKVRELTKPGEKPRLRVDGVALPDAV